MKLRVVCNGAYRTEVRHGLGHGKHEVLERHAEPLAMLVEIARRAMESLELPSAPNPGAQRPLVRPSPGTERARNPSGGRALVYELNRRKRSAILIRHSGDTFFPTGDEDDKHELDAAGVDAQLFGAGAGSCLAASTGCC